jgi:phage-related protein
VQQPGQVFCRRAGRGKAWIASFLAMTGWVVAIGPNLGEPHTKAFGDGLFELRLKGAEGIARVFFCTQIGKRIVVLHSFIKKSDRTPRRELDVALTRLKEMKHADS